MLAIIDARSPAESILSLSKSGFKPCLFSTKNITFEPLSGHPDLFLFQHNEQLIVAPNTPDTIVAELIKNNVKFNIGRNLTGNKLDTATWYNCVVTNDLIIHKNGCTDPEILGLNNQKTFIHVRQSLTRCSLLNINDHIFITSDRGIQKKLTEIGKISLLTTDTGIDLPGYPYGLIGGTAGVFNNTVYFNGNLSYHKEGDKISDFIHYHGYHVEYLANQPLYDGGGIFFFPENNQNSA